MRNLYVVPALCLAALALAAIDQDGHVRFTKSGWYDIHGTYPKYQSSIGKIASAEMKAAAEKRLRAFKKEFDKLGEKPSFEYSVTWGVEPKLRHETVLSFLAQCHFFTGGAHPNHDSETFNFMLVDGKVKRVRLADVMRVRMTPEGFATQIVIPKLKEAGATSVVDGTVTTLTREQADRFYITEKGLTWRFDPYEMGAYAEGSYEVTATWDELGARVGVPH